MSDQPNSAFDALFARARQNPARIVLPEGEDTRVIQAASEAAAVGSARPVLLGDPDTIRARADSLEYALDGIELIDPATAENRHTLQQKLFELRQHKGMSSEKAAELISDNLHYACMMVQQDIADGCVGGAVYPTADVVRTAMQLVGKHPQSTFVSSFFIMLMTQPFHPIKDVAIFADCALVISPDENQLAEIAVCTGNSARQLLGLEPEIAMLSFSTAGSGRHSSVSKVAKATELAQARQPDWRIVGEVQLDAAVIPDILRAKAPQLASDRPLNILIFPNLEAANIGYKICERFGAAEAVGPVLQGLAKPVNDLSRGCKAQDIYNIISVTSAQCQ